MAPLSPTRPARQIQGDALLAGLAWMSATVAMALGVGPLGTAPMVLALPVVAFVATGHVAGRGAMAATLVSALVGGLASGPGGTDPVSAAGLLAMVDLAALAGGLAADRIAPAMRAADAAPTVSTVPAGWSTIVVRHEAVAGDRPADLDVPIRSTRQPARRRSVA